MSLKETQIGVAFTGSFCTYKKAFLELQKLSNCCGSVQTVFSTETSAPFLVNGKGQMTDPEWIQASSREGASRTMETCSETELQLFG